MSLCEALKTNPDTREAQTLAGAAYAALTRALAARREGGCHPQRRMAGIGDRDIVVNNHARAPSRCCTALATAFDTIAPSIAELTAATARRSLERQHRT